MSALASSLLRITAPHFVAGVELAPPPTLFITRAAPIIAYMNGWSLQQALDYCLRKRWSWEVREVKP